MNWNASSSLRKFLAGLLFVGFTYSSVSAATYTSGHGDIGVGYLPDTMEFEPHWHMDSGAIVDGVPLVSDGEFAPGDLIAQASATRNSPIGLFSSLGVADSTLIYVMGSATYQPNLGFAVEELAFGDWTGSITLTLDSVSRPAGAEFALYTTNLSGSSVVDAVFSSYDPNATAFTNSFPMTPGDHVHFQWGFTQLGTYDLEFTWSGIHATAGAISTTETFSVIVIPEPSSLLLVGAALLAALIVTRRRR